MRTSTLTLLLTVFLAPAVRADTEPATSTMTTGAPVQQRKRDFSREISSAIEEADQSLGRLMAAVRGGTRDVSEEQVVRLRSALEAAQAKWTKLNASDPSDFDKAREEAQKSLATLKDAYFRAAGRSPRERQADEVHLKQGMDDLRKMSEDLRLRAKEAAAPAKERLEAAAKKVEDTARTAAAEANELKNAAGDRWTTLRNSIEARFAEAREAYWNSWP